MVRNAGHPGPTALGESAMKVIGLVLTGLLLAPDAIAGASTAPPPPPPPPPEFVDAYIGFERNPEQPPGFPDQVWYYQYALQLQGERLAWHRDDAICKHGRMYSSEGDGAALHYRGRIEGPAESRTAALDYVSCEQCLPGAHPTRRIALPIVVLSPQAIRMGDVVYRKDVVPYPERCPESEDPTASDTTRR